MLKCKPLSRSLCRAGAGRGPASTPSVVGLRAKSSKRISHRETGADSLRPKMTWLMPRAIIYTWVGGVLDIGLETLSEDVDPGSAFSASWRGPPASTTWGSAPSRQPFATR